MNSFYTENELKELGFKSCGTNVFISRKASIYAPNKISIGSNVRIDDFCILSGKIAIGNFIHIAAYSALYGGDEGIEIKDFANISSRVSIYAISDDYSGETMTNPLIPEKFKKMEKEKVIVDRHSIVGSGSVILPGSILKEGCSFGALSLIKGNYESWGIYAGIPSKKIKDRKRDLLELEIEFIKSNSII